MGLRGGSEADGTAMFAMTDQKDVALEIHVTNMPSDPAEPQRDGDDAHEALLTATFPSALLYASARPYDARAPPGMVQARGWAQGGELGLGTEKGKGLGAAYRNGWGLWGTDLAWGVQELGLAMGQGGLAPTAPLCPHRRSQSCASRTRMGRRPSATWATP